MWGGPGGELWGWSCRSNCARARVFQRLTCLILLLINYCAALIKITATTAAAITEWTYQVRRIYIYLWEAGEFMHRAVDSRRRTRPAWRRPLRSAVYHRPLHRDVVLCRAGCWRPAFHHLLLILPSLTVFLFLFLPTRLFPLGPSSPQPPLRHAAEGNAWPRANGGIVPWPYFRY